MSLVKEVRKATFENPAATKLIIPLARAEEFTDAVLSIGAEFKEEIYPLQVRTFLGLEFLGVSAELDSIKVF